MSAQGEPGGRAGWGHGFPGVLAAARTGAEWAWSALYREMAPPVLGYLRARGAADPEDLLGEVFLGLVRDLPDFEGDERGLRAWILRIAHNRLVDDQRRRARRPADPAAPEVLEAGGPTANAEEEGLQALELRHLREVLGELTEDQRSVLLLRILGDLTVEETATVLRKRPGAIKALQRRGLATVKEKLSDQGGVTL